jgi:hypothetical protein
MSTIQKTACLAAIVVSLGISTAHSEALYLKCSPAEKIQWDAIVSDPSRLPDPHQVALGAGWERPVRYKIEMGGESLLWSSDFGVGRLQPLVPCLPDGCRRSSDFYTFVDTPGASGMEDRISINRKTGAWDALQAGRLELKGHCAIASPPMSRHHLKNRF